jgi:ABC-2 type transport system permease protein
MNTIAMPSAAAMPASALLRCYALEARNEFLRLLRTPSFALPTLLFPPLFYLLFGVLLGASRGSTQMATYLLATYGVFGVMAPGLFGFGASVAIDRERGLLRLKRAMPLPPGAYLIAKMAMALIFAAEISIIVGVLAGTLGGVHLDPAQWLALFVIDVLGVLPFAAIGLLIGSVVSGSGAPAVANLVYLPMSFLSGLWLPLSVLPAIIGKLAPLWPAYHLGQIALAVVGQGDGHPALGHVAALAAVTMVCFVLARRRLARAG